jgi:hypothetical protein
MQLELWSYMIAKHFGISLKEVDDMHPETFRRSLVWTLVGIAQEEKANKQQRQEAKSGGRETVSVDYSFLDREDF